MALVEDDGGSDCLDFSELERTICEFLDTSTLISNIKNQLEEYEMIESIFYNPGELILNDRTIIKELQEYLVAKHENSYPRNLDFTVNISIEQHKLEIVVCLPLEYPILEPDIYVRCPTYDRNQQQHLNNALSGYISSLPREEACIYSCIMWIQDNAKQYFTNKKVKPVARQKQVDNCDEEFSRMWIYSHHIYNKGKRKSLQDLSDEYNLSGFCLPGKPGIICFEGYKEDCEDCWNKVKAMNWKKIVCVKLEKDIGKGPDSIKSFRRFTKFHEVSFDSGKARGKEYHSDFGEFYKYLCEHNCEFAFKIFFGIDGKSAMTQTS